MNFKLALLCVSFLATCDAYLDGNYDTLGVFGRKCGGYCPATIVYGNFLFFKVLGSFSTYDNCKVAYQKLYYYPRYINATWIEARSICHSYNMELASFKTLSEANAVISLVEANADLGQRDNLWIFINGVALAAQSKTEWYWSDSGEKVSFAIPWLPTQPDTDGGIEWFLSIGKYKKEDHIGFNDVPGNNFVNTFLCQRCG